MPRLPRFTARWPKVGITVDTSRHHVGFPADGFDFAIRMSRAPGRSLDWVRLWREQLVPVCSPAYRARIVDERGAIDWRRATLIHLVTASEGWPGWLEAQGIDDVETRGGLRFDTAELVYGAASGDLGIALGRRPLVDRELASGDLVDLAEPPLAAETSCWLVSEEESHRRPELRDFKRWLVAEAQAAG